MKKARIVVVGKVSKWVQEAYIHYEKLTKRFARLELIKLSTGGNLNKENFEVIRIREGKKILEKTLGMPVCLDIKGKSLSTEEFAKFIENLTHDDVTFVIGGPTGLSDEVLERCRYRISLSKLTLSHEVALVVFLEQLFRAFKIINGEKYSY
ncbi:MAG: 23S rRNA (pseudouridine(1915)-N(3))-methyltransferase RlmH [Thermotogaceae bacterium]|nr:23S rRNA (pseudouridine(1915)-N(3))-methyltransferase RlmH [Thermotogaceae bacterium]